MNSREQMAENLTKRCQEKDMESRLDGGRFQELFCRAVRDYYPKLKEQCEDQFLYGISFEIGDVVQKTYAENFETYIYFNTEEKYQEAVEDCEEGEESFYRFDAWAEWDVTCPKTELFEDIQKYLEQNSLYVCAHISKYKSQLSRAAAAWYEENESEFEAAFEEECRQIRMWMAEGLGELRKEGFWEEQGSADLYVIPFAGENDIAAEELIESWHIMDAGRHGTEYLDYLDTCES